jgi:hypothetical protein
LGTRLLRTLGRTGGRWENNIKVNIKQDGKMDDGFIWLRIDY